MSKRANAAIGHPGMGAIPGAKRVTFRVWAPHAEKVYVTGTFNDWSKTSTPLAREESGYWAADVSQAKTGDEYRYWIHGPKGPLSRIDPYARKVTSSVGNGVVYDPKAFDWGGDVFRRVIFTESHDEVANGRARVPEEIWPGKVDNWFSRKRSTLAAALVLTSPGIPMLFQGQELLEDRWFQDKDPIDWSRAEGESGILSMYRDLIALRRNRSGVTRGLCGQNVHLYHFDEEAKIIAFHRWDKQGPTDSVVVVVNMTNQHRDAYTIGFPRGGLWKTRFNSDSHRYGPDFADHAAPDVEAQEEKADGLPCSGRIGIGPYTVVIWSQDA